VSAFGVHNGLPFVIDKLLAQDSKNEEAHCAVSQSQVEDQHESGVCHKVFVQSGSHAAPRGSGGDTDAKLGLLGTRNRRDMNLFSRLRRPI